MVLSRTIVAVPNFVFATQQGVIVSGPTGPSGGTGPAGATGPAGPTGPAYGGTPTVTGTSLTLTGPRGYAYCTGTCTVSIPVPPAAGTANEFCILNDNNTATAITLSAIGSSVQYENAARTAYGTAGTGTMVLSAALGNKVCIVSRDATHYFTVSFTGSITVN